MTRDRDRRGNIRLYFRRPGQLKVRLPGPEGSDAFLKAYGDALVGRFPAKPASLPRKNSTSFEWLVDRYQESPAWLSLDEKTQVARRGILRRLNLEFCDLPFAAMTPRIVRRLRDRSAARPNSANHLVKILRGLFRWALEEDLVASNPAAEVALIPVVTDGFHSWTLEEVRQYEARHPVGTMARLAFDLMLYTAARRSDAIRLGPEHVRDGWFVKVQHKGRNRKPVHWEVPVLPPLARSIAATRTGAGTFVVSELGTPFTDKSFGMRFRRWCDAAGLKHCSAHGLRKATSARLAELGCTEHEIAAVTGHTKLEHVAVYTRAANKRLLAASAMARLEESGATRKEETVPPEALDGEGGTAEVTNPKSGKDFSYEDGSPGRIRTSDQPVNSRLLYH